MIRLYQKLDYLLKKEINELYLTSAIRRFAIATISLFIAIYLLEKDFSVPLVLIFYALHYSIIVPFSYKSLKWAAKKGAKHMIAYSVPITILFFWSLYNLDFLVLLLGQVGFIILATIIFAFSDALYWMGYHIEFAKFSKANKQVKQIGVANVIATVMSAIGPIFGALVITKFGFNIMFVIVIVLLFASVIPLMFSKDRHIPFKFSFKDILSKKNKDLVIPVFSEGFRQIGAILSWPLILYYMFSNYNNIGIIYAISNSLLVAFTIYLSFNITIINRMKFLRIGTWINAISFLARISFKKFEAIVASQAFGGLSLALMAMPWNNIIYEKCKKKGISAITYFREFYINTGRVAAILFLLILVTIVSVETALYASILSTAFFTIVFGLYEDKVKIKKTS